MTPWKEMEDTQRNHIVALAITILIALAVAAGALGPAWLTHALLFLFVLFMGAVMFTAVFTIVRFILAAITGELG
jgi:fatty acid desaturase